MKSEGTLSSHHLLIFVHVPRAPAAVARYVPVRVLLELLQLVLVREPVVDPAHLRKVDTLLQTSDNLASF